MKWFGLGVVLLFVKCELNGRLIPLVPLGYLVLLLETREKFGRRGQIPLQALCAVGLAFSAADWGMETWAAEPWGRWAEAVLWVLRFGAAFLLGKAVGQLAQGSQGNQLRRQIWINWAVMAVFGLFLEIPLTVFGRMPPLPVQIFLTVAIVVEIIFFIRYLLAMGRAHRLWPGVR